MSDPLIIKKATEAKRLRDKMSFIPEAKYKQRAVIMDKIKILMNEIRALQSYNDADAIKANIINELKEWYKKRIMKLDLPRFHSYTVDQLKHHLSRVKARGGVDIIK